MAIAMQARYTTNFMNTTVITIRKSHGSGITVLAMAKTKKQRHNTKLKNGKGFEAKQEEVTWACVSGCGACCKLAKGPSFAPPEDIFDDPDDIALYWSLIGSDGWCVNYDKVTRTCSIYHERPYFCRVKPDIFKKLYGIDENKFNKEACGSCRDTIKNVYGSKSPELEKFNKFIRNSRSA